MMGLIVYGDPDRFWEEVAPHLKGQEARNSLLLGLASNFRVNPKGCLFQIARFERAGLMGALLCSKYLENQNLVVSQTDARTAAALFDKVIKSGVRITGIVGETETAGRYKCLGEASGLTFKVNMAQGIYRCRRVRLPQNAGRFRLRAAVEGDVPKIAEWIEAFHYEAVPHDGAIDPIQIAKAKIDGRMIFLIEDRDEPVAMAGWSRDIGTSASVNMVFTPKVFRRNGYGSIVTALLTKRLFELGKRETNLYTDLGNPTSNKIYRNIGYEFVCNSLHYGIV